MEDRKPSQLYVIGPITGIENNNIEEFERVRSLLERYRIIYSRHDPSDTVGARLWSTQVTIPHDVVDENASWEICMMMSLCYLTETCTKVDDDDREYTAPWIDGIAMLDGWEGSRGARIEYDLAQVFGIPCKPWREWLELLQ